MGYEAAINKAWEELAGLGAPELSAVKFLGDEYTIDASSRKVLSLSCNVPAKDFYVILILHYLASRIKGLPALSGMWLDFKEVVRLEGYASAFRARCIEPVIRKYGANPEQLLQVASRLPGKPASQGDAGVVVEAFEGAPVMVLVWAGDEEFSPEANMLFDRSITGIFCSEDIIVLGQIVAHAL